MTGVTTARLRRHTVLLVLLTIVLISIVVRYPLVDHERHNDTYMMRLLGTSISREGYAAWTFHPLSYIGLYAVSYPSGQPFLLAEVSEVTGVGMSLSILLVNLFTAILFAVAVFCLSRELVQRVDIALLAVFLAVMGPRLVDTSYWNGSARVLFVAMAVLVVVSSRRVGVSGRPAHLFILVLLLIGSFALHHMAVLFALFAIAYVLSTLTSRMVYWRGLRNVSWARKRLLVGLAVAGVAISVFLVSLFQLGYFKTELEYGFASSSVFSFEPVFLSILLNLIGSYTNQIGFVLPIAIIALPFGLARLRLSVPLLFSVFLLLAFIPLLPSSLYITMILPPYVAILGAYWFGIAFKRMKYRRLVFALLALLISATLVLPAVSIARWNNSTEKTGDVAVPDNQVFNDGAYLRMYVGEASVVSNNQILGMRLSGVSGLAFLGSGVVSTLTGDVTADEIRGNLSWMQAKFPYNLYLLYEYPEDRKIDLCVIMYVVQGTNYPIGTKDSYRPDADYFEIHSRLLVVVDNRWPDQFGWDYAVLPAKLPNELRNAEWTQSTRKIPLNSYSIYASEGITLFATEVPQDTG